MNIKDEIFSWAKLGKGFRVCDVWRVIEKIVIDSNERTDSFEVDVGMGPPGTSRLGKSISVAPLKVLETLEESEPLAWLGVAKRDPEWKTLQFYTYTPSQGSFSMQLAPGEVRFQLDQLVAPLFEKFPGTNALATAKPYLRSQRALRKRNATDLLLAPAERNFRDNYIEGVSAEMWLGEAFWQYAACSKADVLKADWLAVEDRGSHLHVIAWPEPFSSAEGEQGAVQRRLLKLLFAIE